MRQCHVHLAFDVSYEHARKLIQFHNTAQKTVSPRNGYLFIASNWCVKMLHLDRRHVGLKPIHWVKRKETASVTKLCFFHR